MSVETKVRNKRKLSYCIFWFTCLLHFLATNPLTFCLNAITKCFSYPWETHSITKTHCRWLAYQAAESPNRRHMQQVCSRYTGTFSCDYWNRITQLSLRFGLP